MSNKKFKIKPKVWPKEYTFEEFKQLNPNISENLLINYYHKYLQEYAENQSRHINHFNDTKDNFSKELLTLKEQIKTDLEDGDLTVGSTGATGRTFRSPMDPIKNSIFFDRADDHIICGELSSVPADNTFKPYKELTLAAWVYSDPTTGPYNTSDPPQFSILSAAQNGGWRLYHYHKKFNFVVNTSKANGAKQVNHMTNGYNQFSAGRPLTHTFGPLSGSGWHWIVATYDGRYMKMYGDGKLMTGGSLQISGVTTGYADGVGDTGHDSDNIRVSGSEGAIYYDESLGGVSVPYRSRVPLTIGSELHLKSNKFPYEIHTTFNFWSGSIAEAAVWDKALDADTILDIYQNNVSASQGQVGKYDLLYKGYEHWRGTHHHHNDIFDEGVSYRNVGQYVDNLVGWWKLEENTGTTTEDLSKNKNDGVLYNSPTWSGSYAPGI